MLVNYIWNLDIKLLTIQPTEIAALRIYMVIMVGFLRRYFKPTVDVLRCCRCATISKGTSILIELTEAPDKCFYVGQICVLKIS